MMLCKSFAYVGFGVAGQKWERTVVIVAMSSHRSGTVATAVVITSVPASHMAVETAQCERSNTDGKRVR